MRNVHRTRRFVVSLLTMFVIVAGIGASQDMWQVQQVQTSPQAATVQPTGAAAEELAQLPIKGRAPKTGYTRTAFGDGWIKTGGCDMRNIVLNRDLTNVEVSQDCKVLSGTLQDPYTGTLIAFKRGAETSDDVQIDHVVALSDSWQKGAQQLTFDQRKALANDPLELMAVEGAANQEKSDGDAATWLPENKAFRCQYVARQIAVKRKYSLWVTQAEHDAMKKVLAQCPGQALPQSE